MFQTTYAATPLLVQTSRRMEMLRMACPAGKAQFVSFWKNGHSLPCYMHVAGTFFKTIFSGLCISARIPLPFFPAFSLLF